MSRYKFNTTPWAKTCAALVDNHTARCPAIIVRQARAGEQAGHKYYPPITILPPRRRRLAAASAAAPLGATSAAAPLGAASATAPPGAASAAAPRWCASRRRRSPSRSQSQSEAAAAVRAVWCGVPLSDAGRLGPRYRPRSSPPSQVELHAPAGRRACASDCLRLSRRKMGCPRKSNRPPRASPPKHAFCTAFSTGTPSCCSCSRSQCAAALSHTCAQHPADAACLFRACRSAASASSCWSHTAPSATQPIGDERRVAPSRRTRLGAWHRSERRRRLSCRSWRRAAASRRSPRQRPTPRQR